MQIPTLGPTRLCLMMMMMMMTTSLPSPANRPPPSIPQISGLCTHLLVEGSAADGPSRIGPRGNQFAQHRIRDILAARHHRAPPTAAQVANRSPASTQPHKRIRTTRWHPRIFAPGHRLGARLIRHSKMVASVYIFVKLHFTLLYSRQECSHTLP